MPSKRAEPSFPDELKTWRAGLGFTQAQAAEWLDVPLRTYQEWEQGRQEPTQMGPVRKLLEVSKRPRRKRATPSIAGAR